MGDPDEVRIQTEVGLVLVQLWTVLLVVLKTQVQTLVLEKPLGRLEAVGSWEV